jgi:glycosyltransferase involved in cell wall biosynthesis
MRSLRIAIVHSELKGGAGSEARALWLAEALKEMGAITLMSMGEINLERLNEIYGTRLSPREISLVSIPIPWLFRYKFDAFRGYRLARYIKKNSKNYDVMISAYNVVDFGKPGIQFIADFSFDDRLRRNYNPMASSIQNVIYKKTPARMFYLWVGRILSRTFQEGWLKNLTVANSIWTQKILKKEYGLDCEVLYPPVSGTFRPVSWAERENGFMVLGRFSPEKRIERVISILGQVREKGFDVHLHILGRGDNAAYAKYLSGLSQVHSDWVFLEGLVVGDEKNEFLASHRFGISGCRNEAYGIAVAEMVKAGAIVWVPDGGGQVEIVGRDELIYGTDDDAVEKIAWVLGSKQEQTRIKKILEKRAEAIEIGRFIDGSRRIVKKFLSMDGRLGS